MRKQSAFDGRETAVWSRSRAKRAPTVVLVLALAGVVHAPACAQSVTRTPPNIPLTFGMTPEEVSQALGVQLIYVRGRPGNELLLALPNVKGAALASRSDGLYLQFRGGRVSGWKGDWGTIRP